jgi:hypothetical protein
VLLVTCEKSRAALHLFVDCTAIKEEGGKVKSELSVSGKVAGHPNVKHETTHAWTRTIFPFLDW